MGNLKSKPSHARLRCGLVDGRDETEAKARGQSARGIELPDTEWS